MIIVPNVPMETMAPVRLSMANGGDTKYYLDKMDGKWGNCLNATIDRFARCRIEKNSGNKVTFITEKGESEYERHQDIEYNEPFLNLAKYLTKFFGIDGIRVITTSEAPIESGLGGSAAHSVAVVRAFDKMMGIKRLPEEEAALANDYERNKLGIAGGYQDEWAAALGGLNYMEFRITGHGIKVNVFPISVTEGFLQDFNKRLALVYIPREIGGHELHERQKEHVEENYRIMERRRKNVVLLRDAIKGRNFDDIGKCMCMDWDMKTTVNPDVMTASSRKVHKTAMDSGVDAFRFMGAGAGGCALAYCSDVKNIEHVLTALKDVGVRHLPFRFYGVKTNGR